MTQTRVKTTSEIAAMRESGRMLATVLQYLKQHVTDGISTKQLADLAAEELKRLGGQPVFLGYPGGPGVPDFPDIICISINEEVVHGIPKVDKIVHSGDIVSLDFGVKYQGMITDAAISTIADRPHSQVHEHLVKYTERAMHAGINTVHDRVRTGDIGAAIEAELNKHRYGIVRDLVGHGVGHEMHEDPNIPNYGRANTGPWLDAGMTIAIEPMATLGTERITVAEDGWTILTQDGSWAAHFEHSVLITPDVVEILTQV